MAGGFLSERADELQQGLDDLAAGDEIRQTNALLAIIASELTGESVEGYYQDGFQPTAPGESDTDDRTAKYSSREGVQAADEPQVTNWGFLADTLVVRNITDELVIALKDPTEANDAEITLEPGDSPFVISGVYGIRTSKMWYQIGSGASGNHSFDLLAVKKRGQN